MVKNPISSTTLPEAITLTFNLRGVKNPFGSLQLWKWTGVTTTAITNVHECQTPHKNKNCSKNKFLYI